VLVAHHQIAGLFLSGHNSFLQMVNVCDRLQLRK
jgi:hypothetical protein